jgi:hypothetical protein
MAPRSFALLAVGLLALSACSKPDKAEVAHRMWVDKVPEDARENFSGVLISGNDEVQVGVFHHGSAFAGDWSLFTWKPSKEGRAELELLQDEKTYRVRVDMDGCEVPKGFDYCMVWKGGPGGTKRWYSRARWYVPADTELEAGQLQPQLTSMMLEDLGLSSQG